MAEYKAVDAGQLDADLTLVAEAIRKRAGTSEALAFPEGMAETVRNIPAEGLVLPQLTDPGVASDLAYDKQLIDAYGNVVTGTLGEAAEGMMIGADTESTELSVGQLFVAQGVLRPDMVGNKDFGIIARAGARLVVRTPAENLGDAAASDVAKGKTFTSANGLKVEGTHECETGVTLPALTNPAKATDLAMDKQLIDADGNTVTGTLPETEVGTKVFGSTGIQISGTPGSTTFHMGGIYQENHIGDNTIGFITRPGAQFWVRNAPTSLFGDAAASDVAKGKTFTSAAGLQVEGTLEAGGSGFADGNLLFSEHIVTVEEGNGVTNHANLMSYFRSMVGEKSIFAYSLIGVADTYNQAIMGVGFNAEGIENKICYRYRDGYISVPAALGIAAYDAALVVGTQYKVYCAERIE